MSGGCFRDLVWKVFYLLLGVVVVSSADNASTVLDESNLITSSGCYENVEAGINITCSSGSNELILLKDLLYGKRNGTDPNCSLTNYHDCFGSFSDEQVMSYLHQCSGKSACGPKIVWGQFGTSCPQLTVSDFIFVKYFCFPDTYNLPFGSPNDCVRKEKVFLRYKAETPKTYKCLIESPNSSGLAVRALDVRLQETAQDETGIGACSNDTGEQHELQFDDSVTSKKLTCKDGRKEFENIYSTSKSSILITLDVIGSQVKPESVWIEITSGTAGEEIYVSCDSSYALTGTSVCLPTTTQPTTTTTMPTTTTTTPTTTTLPTTTTTEPTTSTEEPTTTNTEPATTSTVPSTTVATSTTTGEGVTSTTGGGGAMSESSTVSAPGGSTDALGGDGDDGVNEGAIAGGVVGALVLLLLIISIIAVVRNRKKKRDPRKERPESEVHFTPPKQSFITTPPQIMTSPNTSNGVTVFPNDAKADTSPQLVNDGYIPDGDAHVTAITDFTPAVIGDTHVIQNSVKENVQSHVNEVEPFEFLQNMDTSTEGVNVDDIPINPAYMRSSEIHDDDAIFIADTSSDKEERRHRDDSPYRRVHKHPDSPHQTIDSIFATVPDRTSTSSKPESPTRDFFEREAVDEVVLRKPEVQTTLEFDTEDVEYAKIQRRPKEVDETGEHPYGRIERPPSHLVDIDEYDRVDRRVLSVSSDGSGVVTVPERTAIIEVTKTAEPPVVNPVRYSVRKPTATVINTGTPKHKSTITIKTVEVAKKPETTVL